MGKKSKTRVNSGTAKKVKTSIGEVNVMNLSGEAVSDESIQKLMKLLAEKENDISGIKSKIDMRDLTTAQITEYQNQFLQQLNVDNPWTPIQKDCGAGKPHALNGYFTIHNEGCFPTILKQLNAQKDFLSGAIQTKFEFLPSYTDECVRWIGTDPELNRVSDKMSLMIHSVGISFKDGTSTACGVDEIHIPLHWLKCQGSLMCMLGYFTMKYFLRDRFILGIGNSWNIYKKIYDCGNIRSEHWIMKEFGVENVMKSFSMIELYDICHGQNTCMKDSGMTSEWFDAGLTWVRNQVSRGMTDFDKMKCYWTRVGAKKKNEVWFGKKGVAGMCIMAGSFFMEADFSDPRDPLEMD